MMLILIFIVIKTKKISVKFIDILNAKRSQLIQKKDMKIFVNYIY